MMSSDKILPTSIKNLPTEIFLQILGFLSVRELFAAFSGLNSYIDSIIQLTRDLNHVVISNDIDGLNLLYLYSTQISRLIIVNVEMIDLTSLINLRSLRLKYGSNTQFDTIRPENFPILEILHIKGNEQRLAFKKKMTK
jgi:hypothetical protein